MVKEGFIGTHIVGIFDLFAVNVLRGLHDSRRGAHLPFITIRMAETLMRAVEIEAIDEFSDDGQPRHVLLNPIRFIRNVEKRRFRRLLLLLEHVGVLFRRGRLDAFVIGSVAGRKRGNFSLARRAIRVAAFKSCKDK